MADFYQTLSADAVIIGGGFAGIKAAHDCAEAGLSVIMIVKQELCSGSSFYPLTGGLGFQAPCSEEDKEWFFQELQESGQGMQDDKLSRIYVEEVRDGIPELDRMGIIYEIPSGGRKACFAKRERTIVSLRELNSSKQRIAKRLLAHSAVTILEYCDAVTLVKDGDRVAGVVAADYRSRLYYVKGTSVMLATGGYGGMYKHSLNTDDVGGLGHALALEAGAELVNLEFIQFIPGVITPVYKLLFNEISLRFCDGLFNKDGEDILQKYLPEGASERECLDSRGGHGPFTNADISRYFDIAMMSEILRTGDESGFRLQYRPEMMESTNYYDVSYLNFVKANGVDLRKDSLWVAPFGHAANGGVLIDENGATTLPGLYAAGEVSGGLHGADRHGGNATGCCVVFGHRAALSMIRGRKDTVTAPSAEEAMKQYLEKLNSGKSGCVSPDETMAAIRSVLWKNCNVVRSGKHLAEALAVIRGLHADYNSAMLVRAGTPIAQAIAAESSLTTAEALLLAADGRRESRGAHYRQDFPDRDDEQYKKRQFITLEEGRLVSNFR